MGSLVAAYQLLLVAGGILFPDQERNLGPLHWEHGVLATGSPGKSLWPSFLMVGLSNLLLSQWWLLTPCKASLAFSSLKIIIGLIVELMKVKVKSLSCVWFSATPWTPWTPWNLPGSSIHGIFQAIVLEWVAIPSPGDLPDPGIQPGSSDCRQTLYHLSHQGSPKSQLCPTLCDPMDYTVHGIL